MTTELGNDEMSKAKDTAHRAVARKPGILIADDMGLILTLLKFELEPRGFNVWLAVDSSDAIDLYRRHQDQIDLVLLDVQMPGLDGPHTLAHLQRIDRDVAACFMTGNLGIYTEDELLNRGAIRVFTKPFRLTEIAEFLQELCPPLTVQHRSPTLSRQAKAGWVALSNRL
jgi:two-component system, OmpR family, response regulator